MNLKIETVSIVIPVFNEFKTILEIISAAQKAPLQNGLSREIIVVDDYSTDGTRKILKSLKERNIKIIFHEKNMGKGAALRSGFRKSSGDIIIIQDADLEYDPSEYSRLLNPILSGKADVVYGSRFMGGQPHRILYFWHIVGNRFLTLCSNMLSDLNLTDMETCYKVFRRKVLDQIKIEENRFGFEPEFTAKLGALARRDEIAIYEIGISYYGRTYAMGKKIGAKDAARALWCIFKYNTGNFAYFIKYALSGLIAAFSQYLTIVLLVEKFALRNIYLLNAANIASMEIAALVAFALHSKITWGLKFTSPMEALKKFFSFQIFTAFSFLVRVLLFYALSGTALDYRLNALAGIVFAIIFNFYSYSRFVFKKNYLSLKNPS